MVQENLLSKIDEWAKEGLISPEQAETLKQKEMEDTAIPVPARRVKADEILVYLGSLVVVLALAFLVGLNWGSLGCAGRILSALVPTIFMLALGWRLRRSKNVRLRRGAQALLLGGCLLCPLTFGVCFYELDLIGDGVVLALVSCLLATGIAGGVFVLLQSITQSIAFHLCGSAVLIAFAAWLDQLFQNDDLFYQLLLVLASSLVVGGFWLALARWQRMKEKKLLASVSRIFGALTILWVALTLAMIDFYIGETGIWQKTFFEVFAFLACIAFIVAGVKRQSQIYLYSGATFLFFVIIYVNFEHFADKIGMPIVLLIIGVLLIGLGLGIQRLSKRIRFSQ